MKIGSTKTLPIFLFLLNFVAIKTLQAVSNIKTSFAFLHKLYYNLIS